MASASIPAAPPMAIEVKPFDPSGTCKCGDWVRLFGAEPKKVKASYLGVIASPLTPAMRSQLSLPAGVGLAVESVEKDSPAAAAGLKQYDVLQKLNDQILVNVQQLSILVRIFKPGEDVALTVIRQAKPLEIKAKLVEKRLMT